MREHQAAQRRRNKMVRKVTARLLGTIDKRNTADFFTQEDRAYIAQKKIMARIRITGEAMRASGGPFSGAVTTGN